MSLLRTHFVYTSKKLIHTLKKEVNYVRFCPYLDWKCIEELIFTNSSSTFQLTNVCGFNSILSCAFLLSIFRSEIFVLMTQIQLRFPSFTIDAELLLSYRDVFLYFCNVVALPFFLFFAGCFQLTSKIISKTFSLQRINSTQKPEMHKTIDNCWVQHELESMRASERYVE